MTQAMIMNKETKARICRILGMDPKQVRNITLYLTPDDAILADIERYVYDNELDGILMEIKEYEMVPTEKAAMMLPKDD
jgi:hypothetical protein